MYWGRDAHEFGPARFLDTDSYRWSRDAFLAFFAGRRNWIGQRFVTTESVYLLASLVRRHEISVPVSLRTASFDDERKSS
ncbi:hypothetical protein B0H13DRAFT_2303584 [Mycena leptocephala]|nr:hypothetical protein B0H13DRAFT_2303584 [Mycena leptocephala]